MYFVMMGYVAILLILYVKSKGQVVPFSYSNKIYYFFIKIAYFTMKKLHIRENYIYRKLLSKYKQLYNEKQAHENTEKLLISSIANIYLGVLILFVILMFAAPRDLEQKEGFVIKNNKIEKTEFLEGSKTGYVEAEIIEGNFKEKGIYKINIGEKQPTDEQVVERLYNLITDKFIKLANKDLNNVESKLYLPTKNEYGATIVWNSNSTNINIATGEVKRNPKGQGNITAKLNLEIYKNLTKKEKQFTIIILEDEYTKEEQNLEEAYIALDKIMSNIKKSSKESNYIELPTKIDNSNVNWSVYVPKHKLKDDRLGICVLGIIIIFWVVYREYANVEEQIKKRRQNIEIEFCEYLNKLILLIDAGLNIQAAIIRATEGTKKGTYLYNELKKMNSDIASGVYEIDAYNAFSRRCNSLYINKFIAIITQGVKKGSDGLKVSLKEILKESFESRKNIAQKRGEEASTKLILPLVIIFLAIMLLIIYPAIVAIKL